MCDFKILKKETPKKNEKKLLKKLGVEKRKFVVILID